MSDSQSNAKTRSIELEIRIDAPVERVWTALADPGELANWFPLTASGTPGKGGKVALSWGDGTDWVTTIDVWEPNSHVRWVDPPAQEGFPPSAIDFRIEADGGQTIVRLIHSGFSADADWDEMYDATVGGWTYFMYNLRHFVERHFGTVRRMVWTRRPTTRDRSEIWRDLLGPRGLGVSEEPETLAPGQSYALVAFDEPVLGTVRMANAPMHFAGTADSLDDGLFFVELEPGKESYHVGIWLSTYGLADDRISSLQDRMNQLADRIFEPATPNATS